MKTKIHIPQPRYTVVRKEMTAMASEHVYKITNILSTDEREGMICITFAAVCLGLIIHLITL